MNLRMETVGEKIKRKMSSLRVLIKGKICYVLKKKKKNWLVATGFEPLTPAWEFNVTITARANCVFKIESSFFLIITYNG